MCLEVLKNDALLSLDGLGALASCAKGGVIETLLERFDRLYRRKAHMHHFCQYVEPSVLARARETLVGVRDQYRQFEDASPPPEVQPLLDRLVPFSAPV